MRRSDSVLCPSCQCFFGDSNCVSFTTRGPNDPWYAEFILDPATTQLAQCSHNGFGLFAPTYITDPPSVSAYHSTTQEVPYDIEWPLLFNKEYYDTDSMHSTELEKSSRLTFNTAGLYFVSLNVVWNKKDVTTGDVAAFIRVDSSDFVAVESAPYSDEADVFLGHSVTYQGVFEAGQYVEALVKQDGQDSNGDPVVNRILSERFSPVFSAHFLRTAP